MNPRSLSLLALLLVLIPAGVIIRSRASDVATGAEASPPTLRAVVEARTGLLRFAWRKHHLIRLAEVPGQRARRERAVTEESL